ncbi:MAG: hypothetical protein HKP53_08920 [Eudoraea sp.]|nr:hypothetical protein [Eudoraea sp.]
MPKEYKTSLELLQYATSIALYEKLIIQLKKDFTLANISLDLPEEVSPSELKNILKEKIYVLLMERFPEYLNLLYIIDVPEKAFSSIISTNVVEVAEGVCFLVLKREWQKVWLKQSYSTGNKKD